MMNKTKRLYTEFQIYLDYMNQEHYGFKGFLMQFLFVYSITSFTSKMVYQIFPLPVAISLDQDLFWLFSLWLPFIYVRIYIGRILNEKKKNETR